MLQVSSSLEDVVTFTRQEERRFAIGSRKGYWKYQIVEKERKSIKDVIISFIDPGIVV